MIWRLLNQFYVNLESKSLRISVLEEAVSSGQQLVQVLVSGHISPKTMISLSQRFQCYNLIEHEGVL